MSRLRKSPSRLGSLLIERPEAYNIAACALGMANAANGLQIGLMYDPTEQMKGYDNIARLYPWLKTVPATCPLCVKQLVTTGLTAGGIIIHLFDSHVMQKFKLSYTLEPWTIDQLADWVRLIEPADIRVGNAASEAAPNGKLGPAWLVSANGGATAPHINAWILS